MPGFYFWEPLGSEGFEDFAVAKKIASFLNIALVRMIFCLVGARNGSAVITKLLWLLFRDERKRLEWYFGPQTWLMTIVPFCYKIKDRVHR